MEERIRKVMTYIHAMKVDGDNQELAVAAKNELRMILKELAEVRENGGEKN